MFDDLLFLLDIPKNKVPVWEWAKRGWIKDVEELSPYFIALLRYPYLGIKEDDKSQYENLRKNFIMFSGLIKSAINTGELPAKPIDFYDHHWPFSTLGTPGLNPLAEIARKQGKPKAHIQLPTYLIHRDDFREWLIKKGAWQTLQEACLLKKWLEEDKTPSPMIFSTPQVANSKALPFKPPQRSDEWREMILAMVKRYQAEHGAYPTWAKFWGYLCDNPPAEYGVNVVGGKRGVPGKETHITMGESERITKLNLKQRFYRLRSKSGIDKDQ
ncbi:hypothetical protein SAMN02949497_3932 [Methylomagnum ishizawai]|uniref:Uncharacterized protein n=1 Tax=Methylomagnum ishizawai TaxID=1760988 RepID=A0A1Y6D7U0_9GAMM|nr:hypothetical protein [Methylomagnum ishizawai]SMF96532.1 hypothetical protein SAMN02949497_3932 [Methylomagnum ishizawai]